jgi:hypothetical protein
VGTIIGLFTLSAIAEQIRLARIELDIVREDLDNNKKQVAELMRRPDLVLTAEAWCDSNAFGLELLAEADTRLQALITLTLTNRGVAVARDIYFQLLLRSSELVGGHLNPEPGLVIAEQSHYPDKHDQKPSDTNFVKYGLKFDDVLYPGGHSVSFDVVVDFKPGSTGTVLRWSIYDQYGSYPTPETVGKLRYGDLALPLKSRADR